MLLLYVDCNDRCSVGGDAIYGSGCDVGGVDSGGGESGGMVGVAMVVVALFVGVAVVIAVLSLAKNASV